MAISETIDRVNRIYFFDLFGAAGGCLLFVPFLNYFGGAGTVLSAGVFFVVAAVIWHGMAPSKVPPIVSAALALVYRSF